MSIVGSHLSIDGEVSCDEDLTIEGSVTGFVLVRGGTLVIGTSARLEADLRATHIIVHGRVRGAIAAGERIELGPSAVVEGSLSAGQINIAEGARFNGSIDMGRKTIAAKVAEYRSGRIAAP